MAIATITSGLKYRHLKFAHTALLAANQIELLRGRVVVALNATAANVVNIFAHEAEVAAPKTAGLAVLAGATLYWDNVAKEMTTTVATNTKCGVAMQDALAADAVVQMYLTNEVNF